MALSAKEKLFNMIITRYTDSRSGFTAQDCADFTQVNRSVVSHYLNRLCEDGCLTKENTRPVRFFVVHENSVKSSVTTAIAKKQDAFSQLIGSHGSLAEAVMLCRSAVDYPGGGLPALFVGESGREKPSGVPRLPVCPCNAITPDAPFVELNCADYANNPELLSATLFGYVRGLLPVQIVKNAARLMMLMEDFCFWMKSIACQRKTRKSFFVYGQGLLLSPWGQPHPRPVKIRFIFATTENTDTVLLNTFRRRIPVKVTIPNYISRPLPERIAQISHFFIRKPSIFNGISTLIPG
jgi:transcriptional regulator with AAA-type ATPase domain